MIYDSYSGRITSINKNYATNKWHIDMEIDNDISGLYEKYKDCDKLSISLKKWREKRSLSSNQYLWVLCGKIADKLNETLQYDKYTKDDIYDDKIKEYGRYTVVGMVEPAVEEFKKQWKLVEEIDRKESGNKTLVTLICYRGSSTYDSKEMSQLIDGVVSDCIELGIETKTPDELEKMKELWKIEND